MRRSPDHTSLGLGPQRMGAEGGEREQEGAEREQRLVNGNGRRTSDPQGAAPHSSQIPSVVLSVAAVPHPAGPSAQGVEAVTTIQEFAGRV